MRITQDAYYRSALADLMRLQASQQQTEKNITTQKKVNAPSDGRGSSYTILSSSLAISRADQYKTNLGQAQSWMKASDTAMQSLNDLLKRAQVLAEQMSTGTYQSSDQLTTSSEVRNLIDEITKVANTQSQGFYLFSGTRGNTPAISTALVCADPSTVSDASTVGHGTQSSIYQSGASYYLRLSRDSAGATNTITVPNNAVSNNLGAGLGLDFDTWTHTQTADAVNPDVWTSGAALGGPTSAVSNRIGEVLNWDGAAGAGTQTLATTGSVSFSGAGAGNTVTVGAATYNLVGATGAASAANLVEQINAAGAGYYAWLDGGGTKVNIGSTSNATFALSGAGANMTVDNTTTLQELGNQIDSGKQAVGMVHLDNAGLPVGADTITLGGNTWTWTQISGGAVPATSALCATALANFINANTGDYIASTSADGTGATVQVTAKATGAAYNVALTSSNPALSTSGTLLGGLNGADTQGKLFLSGESTLRLATTVRAQVSSVDPASGAVGLHLTWYGDDGTAQSADVALPSTGDGGAVSVPGLGGLSLYRDGQSFKVGSIMELNVGHFQGNQDDVAVNFSTGQRLTYNWNAGQLLGSGMTLDLDGQQATAGAANTGSGQVELSGAFRGLLARDLTINVQSAGQVPTSAVTLRVSWTGDDGVHNQQDVTFNASGSGGKVQLPGGDGVYLQVDNGTFSAGDSFSSHLDQNPVQVLDNLNQWLYQLQNGTQEEAQTQSQHTLQALNLALGSLTNYQAESGTRQDRITVRGGVLDDSKLNNSQNLSDLQDVDLTQAFLDLQQQQTTYQSTLKVISTVSELYLLKYL
jgi:flagellar hook-associated protein 3 FlgL